MSKMEKQTRFDPLVRRLLWQPVVGVLIFAFSSLTALAQDDDAGGAQTAEALKHLGKWVWDKQTFDKQTVRFWNSFEIPNDATVSSAIIYITVDNGYRLLLDGREIGRGSDWKTITEYDVKWLLRPGKHVLAVEAFNDRLAAGLMFGMRIEMADRAPLEMFSDESWKIVPAEENNWENIKHPSSAWSSAIVLGKIGATPWPPWPMAVVSVPPLRPVTLYFWQTLWFQVTMLTTLGIVVLICLWLLTQLTAQSKAQRLLNLQRARIVRDIHDDLGARLTQLVLLGEIAQNRPTLPAPNVWPNPASWALGYQYFGCVKNWFYNGTAYASGSPFKTSSAKSTWMLAADLVVKLNGTAWSDPTAAANTGTTSLPAHKKGSLPAGGNEVFADGSVSWFNAVQMYNFYVANGASKYNFYFYQSDLGRFRFRWPTCPSFQTDTVEISHVKMSSAVKRDNSTMITANRFNCFCKGSGLRLMCVLLVFFLSSRGAIAQTDSRQIYLQCLTNFETYAETIWHASATIPDAGYWGDGGSTGNGGIRGNSGIAVAYATLCMALPDDPKFATRLSRVRQALNYDFNTHVTGGYNTVRGSKWGWSSGSLATCTSQSGSDWQSAEWSGSMGLACLLVQSRLPAATVAGVQTVVASEADHRASIPPCTRILNEGDTKAEENGWDANIVALAAAWMTNNVGESNWLYAAKNYLVNTYTFAYPDLITPDTDGDQLASWISTVTVFPSRALENHGFYHPTYEMVAGMSAGDSLLMARLADANIAVQLQPFAEHNVMAVWTNNLSGMVMDSGDFAYPAGLDWELHDYEQYSFIAWMAAHFNDPVARWDDLRLARLTRYRQQINGDGRFVGTSGGGFYREAVEARRVAISWLHWNFADNPVGPVSAPAHALENLTDVAVLTCRGKNGFVSISYGPQAKGSGPRIMAVIEPPAAGFPSNTIITTPRLPGVIGLGAMGSPTGGRLVNLVTNENGFTAELQLTNGANGTTEVYFEDTGDGVGIVEVPHPIAGFADGRAASFSTGIENDPLCGGSRLLEWKNDSATIANRSGVSKNITNDWICVSGDYGIVFGPAGCLNYAAARNYNRLGAAQDTLSFMPADSLAPRYAVYFPGKNARQTSTLAARVIWKMSGQNATLTFPSTDGGSAHVVTN